MRPTVCLGVADVCAQGLASGFLQSFRFQAIRLPVRIEIPCVGFKNTLDVTSAVQDTDNFDRVRQSMIENDVAAKGKPFAILELPLRGGAPSRAGGPALEAFRKVCR